jgi:hypothetical protein
MLTYNYWQSLVSSIGFKTLQGICKYTIGFTTQQCSHIIHIYNLNSKIIIN